MKKTIFVCLTLIAAGVAASQLPYLLAQDAPPVEGTAAPAAPPAPELPPVPSRGVPFDVPPPTALQPSSPLSAGQAGPQPPMVPPLTVTGTGQGQAVVGYSLSTTGENPMYDERLRMPGLAIVPTPVPVDPRVREMTEKYNQLEMEVMRLAADFRQMAADATEREETVKKIAEITQQQFQLRHDARQLEIERLQKQLEDLQGKLRKREEKRDQIVQQRVEQLTDHKDELRWEPLEPAGAARYMPYGEVYRGQATPPAVVYGSQPLLTTPGPHRPQSARDGQQPPNVPGVPSVPANSDPFFAPPPDTNRFPQSVDGMPIPVEGVPLPNGLTQSILEATTRLEIAEREFKRLEQQFNAGLVPSAEMERAKAERERAQVALMAAKHEQNVQVTILELDVRRAKAALEAAKAELDAQVELGGENGDAALKATLRKAKANLAQMELDVARAEAMLQAIQQQGEEKNSEPAPDTQPKR